jgi:Predicted AAA-ATPase/PD-(D/E)XK nuclease superfamily
MKHSRNFPTSTHYFPDLVDGDAVYVDKTHFIQLLLANKHRSNYFLSRPRRFGKSMFVSVLEQFFLGNKERFKGLCVYDKVEWEAYPVIRLSMDRIGFTSLGLASALYQEVKSIAQTYQIILENTVHDRCFGELIQKLHEKYQKRIVILIDEYDKPIINYIEKEGFSQAEDNRDILKSFYGVLKDNGAHLRFTFITGVSKFAKVSIFSDLNYFDDLTLDTRYATICGFTEAEIRQYCYGGLEDLAVKEGKTIDEIMDKIRYWYNGFSWNAKDFVYNPFSTMRLMDSSHFKNYWFESGTPSFLVKLINKTHQYEVNNIKINSSVYEWHDLRNLDYLSLMLQTGYLTFKKHLTEENYVVGYPNREVENSFSEMLLGGYLHRHPARSTTTVLDIQEALDNNNIEEVITILKNMFKALPAPFFKEDREVVDKDGNTKTVKKSVGEAFYHAIIYLVFKILGIYMQVELITRAGILDAVVETNTHIYLFEFKKDRKATAAMEQMLRNQYAEHYALSKKQIYLIGVCFNMRSRGISDHQIEVWNAHKDA